MQGACADRCIKLIQVKSGISLTSWDIRVLLSHEVKASI